MRTKCNRHSGRYTPSYSENLPFDLRGDLDIHEERVLFDDWNDYRDGMRDGWSDTYPRQSKRTKQFIQKYLWRKGPRIKKWFNGYNNEIKLMPHQITPKFRIFSMSEYKSLDELKGNYLNT